MQSNIYNIILFPEIILCVFALLLIIIGLYQKNNSFKNISNLSILTLILILVLILINKEISFLAYKNFFTNSSLIQFFKFTIIFGSLIFIIISKNFFIDSKLDRFEIPILVLFSSLGMMVLSSSNDLLSMYLGIELQSLALYVVAAIRRDSLESSESGVKYFVLGALSSGILLYGCSLIYGFSGSTNFTEIRSSLSSLDNLNIGLIFGLVFVLSGLAFKISAVPFHMWTPDVYQGAPTSITAFFAIVPKVSGVALIYRFCLEPFGDFYSEWSQIIIFLAISSMFVGAIAAITQTNIKRLLAYSSIGHIGYVLIGLASANSSGIKAVVIYMSIYVIMNISVFTILLSLKYNNKYIEKISDFTGLSNDKKFLALSLAVIMLSMAGIPPFAGFFGKFYIFTAAIEANLIMLAILGVIASVISAYYYLRIIKVMYFDETDKLNFQLNISSQSYLILIISLLFISFFILLPSLLTNIAAYVSIDYFK